MRGTSTGTMRANRSARFATNDRFVTRVDPKPQYFMIFVLTQPDPNTRPAVLLFAARCQPWKVLRLRYGWEKYKRIE